MSRVSMGPVGLILMKLGRCIVVRLLDENLIMPDAEGNPCQFLRNCSHIRMESELAHCCIFAPDVDQLCENVVVMRVVCDSFLSLQRSLSKLRYVLWRNNTTDRDEALSLIHFNSFCGKAFYCRYVGRCCHMKTPSFLVVGLFLRKQCKQS